MSYLLLASWGSHKNSALVSCWHHGVQWQHKKPARIEGRIWIKQLLQPDDLIPPCIQLLLIILSHSPRTGLCQLYVSLQAKVSVNPTISLNSCSAQCEQDSQKLLDVSAFSCMSDRNQIRNYFVSHVEHVILQPVMHKKYGDHTPGRKTSTAPSMFLSFVECELTGVLEIKSRSLTMSCRSTSSASVTAWYRVSNFAFSVAILLCSRAYNITAPVYARAKNITCTNISHHRSTMLPILWSKLLDILNPQTSRRRLALHPAQYIAWAW